DDKSGVDLSVLHFTTQPNADPDSASPSAEKGTPVMGLEKTLKVEISAGDKKKVMPLEPSYETPGSYQAVFYPTIATTYTFRLFGTVNGKNIDTSFDCSLTGDMEGSAMTS